MLKACVKTSLCLGQIPDLEPSPRHLESGDFVERHILRARLGGGLLLHDLRVALAFRFKAESCAYISQWNSVAKVRGFC